VGLEYAFFELIPLDILDGASLFRWNRALWGSLSLVSMFGMYHFVLNPNSTGVQAFRQNGIRTVIVVMLFLLVLTAGLRLAVVFYQRRQKRGA
jgi:hypothetical protein